VKQKKKKNCAPTMFAAGRLAALTPTTTTAMSMMVKRNINTGWKGITFVYQPSMPRLPIPTTLAVSKERMGTS
jgi:hypothetical protein